MKFIGKIIFLFSRVLRKIKRIYLNSKFAEIGNGSIIDGGVFTYENIHIGENVYIGEQAYFLSTKAKIYIGDYCMFGPKVSIITGDHRIDIVGLYMKDVVDKLPENDMDVIIEQDCWIGMGSMILKGVTVGRGSVIAAGAIVTKDVEPYTIYISHNKQKKRFTSNQILNHERKLKEAESKHEITD